MLVFERANHPLGFSTPGNMFSANTPPARRTRGSTAGPGGGARRKTNANSELPYISPGSNNAYGSKAANVPKPPRVADTRTSLAAAMKEKEDAMNARLRAEEEERAREAAARQLAAERANSLAPPSPTTSQPTGHNSREPTVASFRAPSESNELSALTGLEVDRTFASEFVLDPVIGTKVGDDNGGVEHGGGDSEPEKTFHASFDPVPAPVLPKSPRLRRSGKSQAAAQRVPITTARGNEGGDETGSGGGSGGAGGSSGGAPTSSNSGNQENAESGASRKNGASDGNGGKRPPRKHGNFIIPTTRRRRRRLDSEHEAFPRFRDRPLDWCARWYFDQFARYQVVVLTAVFIWVIFIVFAIQYFQALSKGDPLFRGPRDNHIYLPPLEQPRDIHELAERVHLFEKNLGSVDRKLASSIRDEVASLKAALASAAPASAKETESILSSLKNQLDNLHKSTEKYKMEMARELQRTKDEFKRSGNVAAGLLSPSEIRKEIIASVKEALPGALAVSLDPNGGIHTTKPFNQAMEELFDKFFPRRFNEAIAKASPETIKSAPSWDSFLKDNEKRLRTTIDERIGEMITDDKGRAVLGKETVMMLVREQLDKYQTEWEKRVLYPLLDQRLDTFKASIDKEQSQRLTSLERLQKQNLDSFKDSFQRETKDRLVTLESTLKKQTDRQVQNTFNQQQSVLLKKAEAAARAVIAASPVSGGVASGVQIPDYASLLVGGRVWPFLTSPSYDFGIPQSFFAHLVGLFSGTNNRMASHPAAALLPTADAGDCWAFPGNRGVLALGFSQHIYPTHITIEHISKNLVPDYSTAPKTVEFWVQIRSARERARVEEAAVEANGADAGSRIMQPAPPGSNEEVTHSVLNEFVKLGTFEYNIDGDTVQSFELPVDMVRLGTMVEIGAFLIADNYGNDDYTCLYRMKVHGYTYEDVRKGKNHPTTQHSQTSRGWFGRD
ncbi:hypothetical protein FN846DRAFT_891835 [Sphaerosporella brunnea]|uniref:SUN domain-containing protein n=1 Tax=Sphaerosporella brunnea TaxID=1250544 RepID=A0A5J5ERJ5_9PEZI|nr:hypothetical protein FN846DRAFT_891835 [Sphaerosporella brunnea]